LNRFESSLLKAAGVTVGAPCRDFGPATAGGGPCFLRGTRIRTDDDYRPIEQLAVGDPMAARFAGMARVTFIESFTLERHDVLDAEGRRANRWPNRSPRPVCRS
jgi:hypothetical protein